MDFSFDLIDSWQSGLQCNFHFGYRLDVIEEDALNEQCCLQVLRILISKADDEIDELENYLLSLQNELAWVEYGDWSEICCNAFRKRIDFLDVSIKALRNKDKNDVEVQLLLHAEPAEKVDNILKALLQSYCHKIDKQPLDVVINSKSDSPRDVWLHENQKLIMTDLNVAANDEADGTCVSQKDGCTSIDTSSELVQKKPYHSEREEDLEPDDADSKDQTENLLALAPDHPDENIVANMVNVESLGKQGAKDRDYSSEDKIFIQNSPSKSAEKRMLGPEMVKSSEIALNASNMDSKDYSIVYLNKKKKLAAASLITDNEEAKEESLVSTENAIILYSSPISVERMMDLSKEIKPANNPISSVCNQTTSLPKEMNKPCDSHFQVNGNEIQEYRAPANSKAATANVSLFSGCKGTVSITDKPSSAMVNKISPDTLTHTTSVKRNGDNSDSLLCGFRLKKGPNSNVASRKPSSKATKVSSTEKMDFSGSLSMGEGKRKEALLVVKVEETETSPNKTVQSVVTSQVHLQADKEKVKTSFQLKGGEIHLEQNLRLNLSMVPPATTSKELILHSKENNLTSFSGQKRAVPSFLLQDENSRKKRAVPSFLLQGEKQGRRNSVPASRKKRKRPTTTSPMILGIGSSTLGFDFSNLQEGITDSTVKKECLDIVLYAGDSNIRPTGSAKKNLMELTLPDLKAIAKEHKLTKYHKLRKIDLVEKIVNRLARP